MFLALIAIIIPNTHAEPLIELTDVFGNTQTPSIVPYHHFVGRELSFNTINTAVQAENNGPRTFVRSDVHQILTATFRSLQDKPLRIVYGEGSWGEENQKTPLKPHKTHKEGRFLDIFMPVINNAGEPVYFPITEKNLFGYTVSFTDQGIGEAPHTEYQIDWNGLFLLFDALCTHGGDSITKVLIAKDLIPALSTPERKAQWSKIPKTCRQKLVPVRTFTYTFAGKTVPVDHDEHIHVEFR